MSLVTAMIADLVAGKVSGYSKIPNCYDGSLSFHTPRRTGANYVNQILSETVVSLVDTDEYDLDTDVFRQIVRKKHANIR